MSRKKLIKESLRRISIQVMIIVLALYSPAPLQLVLCSESGELPRLEQALNGQCLSGSTLSCGDCIKVSTFQHSHSRDGMNVEHDDHGHCGSCDDELIQVNQQSLLASHFSLPTFTQPGGCLYESALLCVSEVKVENALPYGDRLDPPLPTGIQVSSSTCLLM